MTGTRPIRKSILVRAPLAHMQKVLRDRDQVDAWWGGAPDSTPGRNANDHPVWGMDGETPIVVLDDQLPERLTLAWPVTSHSDGQVKDSTCSFSLVGQFDNSLGGAREITTLTVQHDGIPADEAWDDTWLDFNCGWVTELVYLQLWAERGLNRTRATDPELYRTVEKEHALQASPRDVFRAFTDPEVLGRWLKATVSLDPTPGGQMDIRWDDGSHVGGEIVLLEDGEHAVWHWWDAARVEAGDDPGMVTVATWHIIPSGDGTVIRLVDAGYDRAIANDAYIAEIRTGWDTMVAGIGPALGLPA